MTKALEEQKVLAEENAMQMVKGAFTEGVKQGSEGLNKPNYSSYKGMEIDSLSQTSVTSNGLQQIHQLRPETSDATVPFMTNHVAPAQMAVNIPTTSIQHGATDGNKTFQSVASFNTGKRYKRETNLKFSERNVEKYKSFRSQFNIHHKMFSWDTARAGIKLYMSLEGKAALKVEEVIMNTKGTSNLTEMWNALDRAFLPIDHRELR